MNYRKGLNRVYLAITFAWICWGIFKPIPDRAKAIAIGEDRLDNMVNEFDAGNRQSSKAFRACLKDAGDIPQSELCSSESESRDDYARRTFEVTFDQASRRLESLRRETLADTYWRTGWHNIVEFCLIPPVAVYSLIMVALVVVWWIALGFRSPQRVEA